MACSEPAPPAADLVVRDVAVLDLETGEWAADRSIFVDDGMIVDVRAADSSVPEGAEVFEGEGAWVIPGLWDAHVHSVTNRAWHLPLMVAHGVTAIRNMHTTEPDPWASIARVRSDIEAGVVPPVRFLANGPMVDGDPPSWPQSLVLTDPADADAVVDSLVGAGADFIKVYDRLSSPAFEALLTAAAARGVPVDGHVPFRVPAKEAVQLGMRTVEHLSGMVQGCSSAATEVAAAYTRLLESPPLPFPAADSAFLSLIRRLSDSEDEALCAELVDAYASSDVAVTPTLVNAWSQADPAGALEDQDAASLLPPDLSGEWGMMAGPGPGQMLSAITRPVLERLPAHVRRLKEAGVPVLVGTDTGNLFLVPGASVHEELILLAEAGLTPLEAIRAATVTPADVFGLSDSLGHVRPGYLADFVLLASDPTADIEAVRDVATVVLRGRPYDRAALDSLLAVAGSR